MSFVTQENKGFQPVTIVIDDVRTLNLIRFALDAFAGNNEEGYIAGHIRSINDYPDAEFALDEIKCLHNTLLTICKD